MEIEYNVKMTMAHEKHNTWFISVDLKWVTMVKNVQILDILLQKHYVSTLFLAYIFLLEVVDGIPRPPQFKDTSGMYISRSLFWDLDSP